MEGTATCHGAATIVNGIATGKGAAYGIGLKTMAKVELTNDPDKFEITIEGDETESTLLAQYCVREVLRKFGLQDRLGARIRTSSDIPISRGLKSSSAAANSIILATLKALDKEFTDMEVIHLGIDVSLAAKVTITGAFDDACATYFGGVVVTDNITRKILSQYPFSHQLDVIIHVPERKIRKVDVDTMLLKGVAPAIDVAHDLALKKNYQAGILINGLAYGTAMGLDTSIALRALKAGAQTAGISGTGPATVILAKPGRKDDIISALEVSETDQIICTSLNNKKAE